MTDGWRVTVSILAYHSADSIEAAVRSALEQDHPGPVDVVVRVQGSDPDELALLSGLAAASWPSGRTLVVTEGENLGFAGGHNAVLRSTAGDDAVLVLNADASLEPSYLRIGLAALASSPTVGAVQGKVLRPDRATIDTAGLVVGRGRGYASRDAGEPATAAHDVAGEVFGPDGAVSLFRRAALDEVAVDGDVYAPEFFAYFEDVDLAWRLRWRGWRTRYEPAAVAVHSRSARGGEGGIAWSRAALPDTSRRYGWGNRRLVAVRNEGLRVLGDPAFLGRELASWAILAARPKDLGPAVRHLKASWRPARAAGKHIKRARLQGVDPRRSFAFRPD